MRKSLISIASGAIITAVSLLMLALAFPLIAPLLTLLTFATFLIVALSLLAMVPEFTAAFIREIRKSLREERVQQPLYRRVEVIREEEK